MYEVSSFDHMNVEFDALPSKLIKIHNFKNFCCRFDIVERHVDEAPSKQVPPDIVKTHLVSDTIHNRKGK